MVNSETQGVRVAFSLSTAAGRADSPRPPKLSGPPEGGWAPLVEAAAREVLETMMGGSLVPVAEPVPPDGEITAMVGLAGGLCAVLSVRCRFTTANLFASRMLGVGMHQAEPATLDALGEIANVVAGCLKTKVPDLADTCFLSTPAVVMGHDFKIYSLGHSSTTEVAFDFEGARVWFGLDVHQ